MLLLGDSGRLCWYDLNVAEGVSENGEYEGFHPPIWGTSNLRNCHMQDMIFAPFMSQCTILEVLS